MDFSINSGGSYTGTTAGLWTFRQDSGPLLTYNTQTQSDLFVSFCIDLADGIGVPSNDNVWDVVSLNDAPDPSAGPMNARAADLEKLLGGAITTGSLNDALLLSATDAAALQIAVWEVVHESSESYNVASGLVRFQNAAEGVLAQATTYLTGISTAKGMVGLKGLTSPDRQDFVGQVVPIPAAAWLFGSALMGTIALGRRKQKKELAA